MWPYSWQFWHWDIVLSLLGFSTSIFVYRSEDKLKIFSDLSEFSKSMKNKDRGSLVVLCKTLVICLITNEVQLIRFVLYWYQLMGEYSWLLPLLVYLQLIDTCKIGYCYFWDIELIFCKLLELQFEFLNCLGIFTEEIISYQWVCLFHYKHR